MRLKHCAYCHGAYAPLKNNELSQTFCTSCILQYRDAETRIAFYSQKHPGCSAAQLIMDLRIPAMFVHYQFRLGKFFPELARRQAPPPPPVQQDKPCYFCHRRLKEEEDVYCTVCNDIINQRMHTRYNLARPAAGLATMPQERGSATRLRFQTASAVPPKTNNDGMGKSIG